MNSQNSRTLTNSFKRLTGLVGAAGASLLLGLPALAQVNPSPSILNEAPYNNTGETAVPSTTQVPAQCVPSSGQTSSMGSTSPNAAIVTGDATAIENNALNGAPYASYPAQSSPMSNALRQEIAPTGGTSGGFVIQRYEQLAGLADNSGMSQSNNNQASVTPTSGATGGEALQSLNSTDNTNSSRPIYRVNPSNPDSQSAVPGSQSMSSLPSGSTNQDPTVQRNDDSLQAMDTNFDQRNDAASSNQQAMAPSSMAVCP